MKRFLACIATAIAICLPSMFVTADEENSAGRVRLQDDSAPAPPIPSVIGSDPNAGRATLGGPNPGAPALPDNFDQYTRGGGGGRLRQVLDQDPFTVQYRLNRSFGNLYGYEDGFTGVGAFIPRIVDENSIFFFDLRGFVTDNQDAGFNLGAGRRWYNPNADRVWSHSLWLDFDGGHVEDYVRGGYSGSMTSRYWRYRWNGYWVMGDQNNIISTQFDSTPYGVGSNLAVNRLQTREVAYSGLDMTVGGPLPLLGQYGMSGDVGVYYNGAEFGKDAVGFLAQVDAQLTEDISLAGSYSDDAVFGANFQMNMVFNLPDGRARRFMRQPRVQDYMLRSDDRRYRIATERFQENTDTILLNSDGSPITIAYIDPAETPDVTPAGDGSIDNRFNSLAAWELLTPAEKAAFNIILVDPGTNNTFEDNTYTENLNTGITIFEGHRLLASTGRLVRNVDSDGIQTYSYAAHQVVGTIPGFSTQVYEIPGTDVLAGTTFAATPGTPPATPSPFTNSGSIFGTVVDPDADPRPILSNHIAQADMVPNTMYNVVTIDSNFSSSFEAAITEVSGFVIDGNNPFADGIPDNDGELTTATFEPRMLNNGIQTSSDLTSFDINSNFIRDTVHAVNITSNVDGSGFTNTAGEAVGYVRLNAIEGDGFYSNSGIHVEHDAGTLNLSVQDNLVYGIYGEDMDNDGNLDTVALAIGTEDANGNGKLDIGEDLNNDGLLSVGEDNDKDGVISSDDMGIAINLIANNDAIINASTPDLVGLDGTIIPGFNISRNTTFIDESVLGRDVNGFVNRDNINTQDTLDIVGNRSGINLQANDTANFVASVADNDTSFNNPYSDVDENGDYVAPEKNEDLVNIPPPRLPQVPFTPAPNGDGLPGDPIDPVFGNGFGFRSAATNAGAVMQLNSPNRHVSNNNYGNGAVFSATNGGTFEMLSPMLGEVVIDENGLITDVIAPSEYNNNGLNGLLISGDGAGSSLAIQVGVSEATFLQDDALTTDVNEAELVDTIFERTLNQFTGNGSQFGSGTEQNAFENGNGIFIDIQDGAAIVPNSNNISSGIFHAQANSNVANGILVDVGAPAPAANGALLQNFTIDNSDISGNGLDGISISAQDANDAVSLADLNNGIGALHNLRITNNVISAFGTNGINFQVVNSDITNLFVSGNTITSDIVTPDVESLFDIDLNFLDTFSATQTDFITSAAALWEQAIIGDLPDVVVNGNTIDDIRIDVSSDTLDGSLGTLAVGGFSFANLRPDATELPFISQITFDVDDLDFMETNGIFEEVAVHEMGHALGFLEPFWTRVDPTIVEFPTATTPVFVGPTAVAQYNAVFGLTETGVPLQSNGNNLAGSHWDEGVFDNELMTPSANPAPNPLSTVTIGLMEDIGYTIDLNAAQPYTPPFTAGAPIAGITFSDGQIFNTPAEGVATLVTQPEAVVVIDPTVFDTTDAGNSGNGINLSILDSNLVNAVLDNNTITNVGGDGIRMINPQFRTNTLATRNDPLITNPPGSVPATSGAANTLHIQLSTITGSDGYGVNLSLDQDNQLDTIICVNDISENTLGGINVEIEDTAIYRNGVIDTTIVDDPTTPVVEGETSFFFGNTVNNNGGIGYSITAEDQSQFTVVGSLPTASTFDGNQDAGIGVVLSQTAEGDFRMDNVTISNTQDADVGDPEDNDTFNGEGIGIVLNGNSVLNDMRIGDPIISNPANPRPVRQTNIINNLNNGVSIVANANSSLQESLIANSNISGNGTNGGLNPGDGINVVRNGSAIIGDDANVVPATVAIPGANIAEAPIFPIVPNSPFATVRNRPAEAFVIRDSNINNNGGQGIDLTANLSNINDEYLIEQNNINGNGLGGITLLAQGDAEMYVDIRHSRINDNTGPGISLFTTNNSTVDEVSITGSWLGLEIDGNSGDGILLAGAFGDVNDGFPEPLQIGSNFTEDANGNGFLDPGEDLDGDGRLDTDAVFITNNGGNGINIPGGGVFNLVNAVVEDNDGSGLNITGGVIGRADQTSFSFNGIHGVNLQSAGTQQTMDFTNSLFEGNTRDGLQMSATNSLPADETGFVQPFVGVDVEVTMDTNIVVDNGGRGIDNTVRSDGSSSLDITDIIVVGNGEQGIYNLVTASADQDLEASAEDALAQNGSLFANAFMEFSITATNTFDITALVPGQALGQNLIANNGLDDGYDGGGLVFRVGTTGADETDTTPWNNTNTVNPRGLGGLVASIENTNMISNNGVDFWMHTFTSTVTPPTSAGSWTDQNTNPRDNTNDVFAITTYEQDPLARIEINSLANLTGGSADVFGASQAGGTSSNLNFAFYNNAESVFKSRGITGVGPDNTTDGGIDDDGPFNTGSRRRNATRLPARTTFVEGITLNPDLTIVGTSGSSDAFLYPGVGESTLQIANGIPIGDRLLLGFTTVITNFTDQIPIGNNGGINANDTDYRWEDF